jgi:hypothetical protein
MGFSDADERTKRSARRAASSRQPELIDPKSRAPTKNQDLPRLFTHHLNEAESQFATRITFS